MMAITTNNSMSVNPLWHRPAKDFLQRRFLGRGRAGAVRRAGAGGNVGVEVECRLAGAAVVDHAVGSAVEHIALRTLKEGAFLRPSRRKEYE